MDLIPPDKVPEGCRTACHGLGLCIPWGYVTAEVLLQQTVLFYPLSSGHPFKHAMSVFTNGVIIGGAAPD